MGVNPVCPSTILSNPMKEKPTPLEGVVIGTPVAMVTFVVVLIVGAAMDKEFGLELEIVC